MSLTALGLTVFIGFSARTDAVANALPESSKVSSKPNWRLGFYLGLDNYVIEVPLKGECDWRNDPESELGSYIGRLWQTAWDASNKRGVASSKYAIKVPQSKIKEIGDTQFLGPKAWTVLNLNGNSQNLSFTTLVVLEDEVHSHDGCFFLGSESMQADRVQAVPISSNERTLIIAFSNPPKVIPGLRSAVKGSIPTGYEEFIKGPAFHKATGTTYAEVMNKQLITTSYKIRATIDSARGPEDLWLLNWSSKTMEQNMGSILLRAEAGHLAPIFIRAKSSKEYGQNYSLSLLAAIDLTEDGRDELIMEAAYSEGTSYIVYGWNKGKLSEIYSSAYYGL